MARLLDELKRRKVVQTAGVYLVGSFVVMQVVDDVVPYLPLVTNPEAAGRVVVLALIIGFPITLGLSWAFELTLGGFRRELTLLGGDLPARPGSIRPKLLRSDAVAVLPFENLSGDPENQYFSDGITDDIIAAVAHVEGLRVLSRSSVMHFRDENPGVQGIAAELGVGTVVDGSVRRSGTRVRVVAKVVDGATQDLVWSETYDRELQDIFEVQSDIAASIAVAVQRELTAADRSNIAMRGTTDPAAYDLYLRARHQWNQRTEAAVELSLRTFERALERDPDFALAHSGLAEAYTILGVYGAMAPKEVFPKARTSAEQALSLLPDLGEAVAAQACISAVFEWDWAAAEERFKQALELSPSYPTARQWYAMNLLVPLGRFGDALQELEQASELDPGSRAISVSKSVAAFYSRAYPTAAGQLEHAIEVAPDFALAHYFLGQCRTFMGQTEEGLDTLATAVDLSDASSESLAAHGHALAASGRTEEAEAILSRLGERAGRRYVSPVLVAQVLVGLGRHSEAIDELTEAVAAKSTDLIWLAVRPHFDPLREIDAFRKLLERVNLGGTEAK